jgi:hypothetical protein
MYVKFLKDAISFISSCSLKNNFCIKMSHLRGIILLLKYCSVGYIGYKKFENFMLI